MGARIGMAQEQQSKGRSDWGSYMVQAQQGDHVAYEKLLFEVTPVVRSYLLKKAAWLGAPAIEDLVQETLLGVHHARHTYDPSRNFSTWLIAIAHYKLVDQIRRGQKNRGDSMLEEEQIASSTPDGEALLMADDLKAAIAELPQDYRAAVMLVKVQGFSVAEAATELNISEANVKVRVHRALQKLRKQLLGSRDDDLGEE